LSRFEQFVFIARFYLCRNSRLHPVRERCADRRARVEEGQKGGNEEEARSVILSHFSNYISLYIKSPISPIFDNDQRGKRMMKRAGSLQGRNPVTQANHLSRKWIFPGLFIYGR
jgi:hypothetical protein